MKIEIKPKYFPLIQKPMLCNVTCLEMILHRRGFGLFNQEDLAYEMGMSLPKDYLPYFSKPFKEANKNWDLCFWLELAEERLNKFFEKHKIPLKAKVYFKSEIEDVEEFVIGNLKNNKDMWTMSANKAMYKTEGGHDILIQAIDTETKKVTVVDPQPEHKQVREESLDKLFDAMDKKWGRERGFVVI